MNGSINRQFVADWLVLVSAASTHDESMAVLDELRVGSAVDKLGSLLAQHAVEVNVERILLQHHAICFVVDFDFPGFEDS